MTPPTRKIVGQAVYGDGTGASGRLLFSPEFLVAYDGVVVLPGPVTVIAGNGGHFEVELATTDSAGYSPEGWVWKVAEQWPGGRTFLFEFEEGDGSPVTYTNLIPAESIADPYAAHTHPDVSGLPDGGDAGDLIVKQSSVEGDAEWQAPGDIGLILEGDARLTDERTPTVHGNEAHTLDFVDATGASAAAPVQSVNGQTGDVSLEASDVGAYPDSNPDGYVDAQGAADAAPVQSVNGETGDVILDASDVGALPDDAQLGDLSDVKVSTASASDLLSYDGNDWVPTDQPAVKRVSFDTAAPGELDAPGDLAWSDMDQSLAYRTNGIKVDIGQENLIYVRNPQGAGVIPAGTVVAFDGADAQRIRVQPCKADEPGVGCATAGIALNTISSPGFGFVSTFGLVRGFNTNNILTDGGPPVTQGQEVFISTTPGVLATFPAPSPARRVTVGYIVTTGTQGSIFVTVRRGLTVNELDNVLAASPSDGQTLTWDNSKGVWEPKTPVPAPVNSVNNQTGDVDLSASDVGALPDDAQLNDLSDVNTAGAQDGDALAFDSTAGAWVPATVAAALPPVAHSQIVIAEDYTFPANTHGISVDPVTVGDEATVTVPDGAVWTIII